MPFLHSHLHLHRDNPHPLSASERLKANDTMREYLDAFQVIWTVIPTGIDLGCRTLLGQRFNPESIMLPRPRDTVHTLFETPQPDWLLHRASLTELAIAWKRQGVIDRYCDLGRWSRRIEPWDLREKPQVCDRIRLGCQALGIPLYQEGEYPPWEQPPHQPCPRAAHIAALAHRSTGDSPDAAVILMGSRGRGDHLEDSDTDIMVALTDEPDAIRAGRQAAATSRRVAERVLPGAQVDVCIVDRFGKTIWQNRRERLFPGAPSGLVFGHPRAISQMPLGVLWDQPHPSGGLPFYFLTGEAHTGSHQGEGISLCSYQRLDLPRCKP